MIRFAATALAFLFAAAPAVAHEFWIEPEAFRIEPGERLRADLKVGQDFKGDVFPYLRNRFVAYRTSGRGGTADVAGYDGASPSLDIRKAAAGLAIVSYLSTADRLIYRDWEIFIRYTEYEGLDDAVAEHRARGLPEKGFSETYVRCAKALIQVGEPGPRDMDRRIGMPLELVALANPYGDPAPHMLRVRLFWQGEPLADTQVSIFRRGPETDSEEKAVRTLARTDAEGVARIPLAGGGRFLLNAVHLEPADPQSDDEWQSHWASLTFAAAPD
jgi:uncharacterized GH25 family protein